ncbi:MAG: phenylalanine--tRNA ligase subunit alpha [Candidatus Aminicenantes bacterium]|nr:phenylalanine--tRNA ligase subunit alpha [Candidatus Aminicenantes bacterium]
MKDFKDRINHIKTEFDASLEQVKNKEALQDIRNLYLSRKKGKITLLFNDLAGLEGKQKPEAGKLINALKTHVLKSLDEKSTEAGTKREKPAPVDLTLPGHKTWWGAPHPVLIFKQEIENIFTSMGFSIADGPEIETDYYNFEALNFPPHHPARDDWDTLYLDKGDLLLRTHTSPVQIRVMEKQKPPIRIVIPGRVYRKETSDPTHLPMFYQIEGLVVDKDITFSHLKGTLEVFLRRLFNENLEIRFRPSFFPFTEPSAEVDMNCTVCKRQDPDCRVCGGSGWIEILGAGMVDPQVLKNVSINPEEYSGFAFGMGIDRTAMFAYRIPDMRLFYENDLRFIRQFSKK